MERPQVAIDLFGCLLDAPEAAHERIREFFAMGKVAVMCSRASNVPPNGLGGMVLR